MTLFSSHFLSLFVCNYELLTERTQQMEMPTVHKLHLAKQQAEKLVIIEILYFVFPIN